MALSGHEGCVMRGNWIENPEIPLQCRNWGRAADVSAGPGGPCDAAYSDGAVGGSSVASAVVAPSRAPLSQVPEASSPLE